MEPRSEAANIDTMLERSGISRRFVDRALSALRWAILATLLLITWLWPFTGRTGHMLWVFVLAFVAYNAVIEILRWRVPFFQTFSRIALLDLPVAAILFYLDYSPGGPLFVLFYLGLISASLTMSARGTVLYTAAVIIIVSLIAPTLPGWSASADDLRQLSARLAGFGLVGLGTALLAQRLVDEMRTSRRFLDEALRREQLTQLRDDFVASTSHDLRTPLTAIQAALGMLDMRASGQLGHDELQLLHNARRNVERLNLLIDDLLVYNQIETATLHLDRERVVVANVINEAIATVDSLLAEKGQLLDVSVSQELTITGDSHRLQQVFVNLLANANRHTPRGTRIAVAAGANSNEVVVTIQDNGPGIPADHLPHLFDRFNHRVGIGGGSGLGLMIAYRIVHMHSGRIWVEASDDGSEFHVALPVSIQGDRGAVDDEMSDRG